jgi:hypothetical protein
MKPKQPKPAKEPKPVLLAIHVKDTDLNSTICSFPPTKTGERYANRFKGLTGIKILKIYEKGGKVYESN